MTAVKHVFLRCEGPGCQEATGEWDATTFKEAREIARALGWTRTEDGRDLCERHPKGEACANPSDA